MISITPSSQAERQQVQARHGRGTRPRATWRGCAALRGAKAGQCRTRPHSAVLCGALQVGWCIIEVNGRTVPSDDAQLIKEVLKGLWY